MLYALYAAFHCPAPPLLYGSLFALLFFDVVCILVEGVVMAISARGSILRRTSVRKRLTVFLYIRMFLEVAKVLVLIVCTSAVAIASKTAVEDDSCSMYSTTVKIAIAAVVFLWVRSALFVTRGCCYIEPLGLCTPGLLQHFHCLDRPAEKEEGERVDGKKAGEEGEEEVDSPPATDPTFSLGRPPCIRRKKQSLKQTPAIDEKPFYSRHKTMGFFDPISANWHQRVGNLHRSHIGSRMLQRRLTAVCCCLGIGGQRLRGNALEDLARAIYTLFNFDGDNENEIVVLDDAGRPVSLVFSDVLAGLHLLNQAQHEFKIKKGDTLSKRFRRVRGAIGTVYFEMYILVFHKWVKIFSILFFSPSLPSRLGDTRRAAGQTASADSSSLQVQGTTRH